MPIVRTRSVALLGLTGAMVEIEVDLSSNLPGMVVIGLPDAALSEARDRVRAAAANSGLPLPGRKLTVNLSPASLPKHGSCFDLGIALAALATSGGVDAASVASVVHFGELGLDGRLRPVAGALPAVLAAARAGADTVMVAEGNRAEAELVPEVRVVGVASLREAAIWHGARIEPHPVEPVPSAVPAPAERPTPELAEVIGNPDAVDALVTAAAGGHHLMMLGPPGAGKTMLASRLPALLPDLGEEEALEVTCLRSVQGRGVGGGLMLRPPFEQPHHTASAAALVGGGSSQIKPGAAVMASHGVLFLDEAPEFSTAALDALRQPLETGQVVLHRVAATATYPATFQLVLAANPCLCGKYGTEQECTCPPSVRRRYLARISGPLKDRIDLHLQVNRVTAAQLRAATPAPSTLEARQRITAARERSAARWRGMPWRLNAKVPGSVLRGEAALPRKVTATLDSALERGLITMRGYDRMLRVAWTLADLAGREHPDDADLSRALYLRGASG